MTKETLDGSFQDHAPFSSFGNQHYSGVKKIEQQEPAEANNSTGTIPNQTAQKIDTWTFNVEDIDPSVINELPLEIQREIQGWLQPPKRANTSKRGSSIEGSNSSFWTRKEALNCFFKDHTPSSSSGNQHHSRVDTIEQQGGYDAGIHPDRTGQKFGRPTFTVKDVDPSKCASTSKRSSSIESSNSSSSVTKEALDGFFKVRAPLSFSGSRNCSGVNKIEQQGDPAEANNDTGTHPNQTGQKMDMWTFNTEDIDPSIVDELPLEIQREVQGWRWPHKHAKSNKRDSSIVHYFSSAKKS